MVNGKLIERGLTKARNKHARVGIPVYNITNLIRNGSKDNANMIHNPETVHKSIADHAMKEYALNHCLKSELSNLHLWGDLHVHDLEFFAQRPINCLQHDLRYFIRNGLKVDGTGEHTSVAAPPKHIETLANHSGEIMLAAQQHMSGGQSMSMWNVFAAPFAAGRTYEDIKQAMQMFIFNLNMAYAARGSQVPFTSVSLEFTIPRFLEDTIAYGPNGVIAGTYGDFEREARMIQRAFTEVLIKGDMYGKPHLFPNTIYHIRDEMMKPEFEDDVRLVHELAAKYGTPYFANMLTNYRGKTPFGNYMGCRTALNPTFTGDWEKDCFRTGNASYVTLNLPRLAYLFGGDEDRIFERLGFLMEKAAEIMLIRYKNGEKCLNEYNLLPFLSQTADGDDEPYYSIENATLSYGILGMNEFVQCATGYGIGEDEGTAFAMKVMHFINDYAAQLGQDTGRRFSVLQTPAETTTHRFALLDLARYPEAKNYAKGTLDAPYYTNSTHVPVDSGMLLPERIKTESQFHPLTPGGHIFHAWMGESYYKRYDLCSEEEKNKTFLMFCFKTHLK